MLRSKTVVVVALIALSLMLTGGAYQLGLHRGRRGVYRTQAILAFAHYKFYGIIADYLEKKCYDAALAEAKGLRDEQAFLFADNLRDTGNDPHVMAYVRFQDPEFLKSVLAGHTPKMRPFSTTCSPVP
jgi:hypothetical protein